MLSDVTIERDDHGLAVRTGGASDGPLVVHLHGAPSSRFEIDLLDDAATRLGIRLAAVDRPGYGGSDYYRYTFASVTADICAVADAQGVDRFHVLGQSAGCHYALGAAALAPERVRSAAIVGGGTPLEPGDPAYEHLSEGEKQGVALIGVDDDRAAALMAVPDEPFSVAAREWDDEALLTLWRSVLSPVDRGLLEREREWSLRLFRESQRPGQQGWIRDNVVRGANWSFDPATIRCPVTVWFGTQDAWRSIPWLVQHVPTASAHVLRDRGHMLLFVEPDLVLTDLIASGESTSASQAGQATGPVAVHEEERRRA